MNWNLKKLNLIAALVCTFGLFASAQDVKTSQDTMPKMRTLAGALRPKINYWGIYIAPQANYLNFAGATTVASGMSANIIFNKKWSFGVMHQQARNFTPSISDSKVSLQSNYSFSGGVIEYTLWPNKIVHLSFPVMLGMGSARVDSLGVLPISGNFDGHRGERFGDRGDRFFVIQPNVNVEVNLFRFLKLYAGAGYRVDIGNNVTYPVTASQTNTLSQTQLSGYNLEAGLKIGLFDAKKCHWGKCSMKKNKTEKG